MTIQMKLITNKSTYFKKTIELTSSSGVFGYRHRSVRAKTCSKYVRKGPKVLRLGIMHPKRVYRAVTGTRPFRILLSHNIITVCDNPRGDIGAVLYQYHTRRILWLQTPCVMRVASMTCTAVVQSLRVLLLEPTTTEAEVAAAIPRAIHTTKPVAWRWRRVPTPEIVGRMRQSPLSRRQKTRTNTYDPPLSPPHARVAYAQPIFQPPRSVALCVATT